MHIEEGKETGKGECTVKDEKKERATVDMLPDLPDPGTVDCMDDVCAKCEERPGVDYMMVRRTEQEGHTFNWLCEECIEGIVGGRGRRE